MLTAGVIARASELVDEVLEQLREMYDASLALDRERYVLARQRWRAANAVLDELLPLTIEPQMGRTSALSVVADDSYETDPTGSRV